MTGTEPRRFGRFDVHLLRDGVFEIPSDVVTHSGGEAARQHVLAGIAGRRTPIPVNCFLLQDASDIMLLDAGTGSWWGEALGHARAGLAEIGIRPQDVGKVLLTHIHGDHALGLFEGEEKAFPDAEILVPSADLDFFTDEQNREAVPAPRRGTFDLAARLMRIYGGRVSAFDPGEVVSGIEAIPLPGHTPGHTAFLLADAGRPLLHWADAIHLADLQPADPAVCLAYDLDVVAGERSRRDILDRAAQGRWIVTGSHFPGYAAIRREGAAYRLDALWSGMR